MKTFRVWAECINDCYADIEAESEEEALEIAWEMDGGDFITDDSGDWRITNAELLDDDDDDDDDDDEEEDYDD